MWMVLRISVAWTRARRSIARVTASRFRPSTRDQSPTYVDGAALEQQLSLQQSTVELPLGEDALGHVPDANAAKLAPTRTRRRNGDQAPPLQEPVGEGAAPLLEGAERARRLRGR